MLEGKKLIQIPSMFLAGKCSGPFIFDTRRPPKRNLRKFLGKDSQAEFLGLWRPLLLFSPLKHLKASMAYWPWENPLRCSPSLISGFPEEPQPGTATLNGQLVGHSSCVSPHKLLFHIPFIVTYACTSVRAALGGWAIMVQMEGPSVAGQPLPVLPGSLWFILHGMRENRKLVKSDGAFCEQGSGQPSPGALSGFIQGEE